MKKKPYSNKIHISKKRGIENPSTYIVGQDCCSAMSNRVVDRSFVDDQVDPINRGFDVRAVQARDIPQVVDVHMASFQNFFLTFLGPNFLECLYREIATEPDSVFLVAVSSENRVLGFAAGVQHLSRFYRRLVKAKWMVFGWASVGAVLRQPRIILRLWRAKGAPENAEHSSCPATLMSIAVAQEVKGMGIGKLLIHQFLEGMAASGTRRICLVTDRDNNYPTIAFYEGLNFIKVREYPTPEGRWMSEYMTDTRQAQG